MDMIELLLDQDEQPSAELACPVCGGELIPLRDYYRCSRCAHGFCESCEGDANLSDQVQRHV